MTGRGGKSDPGTSREEKTARAYHPCDECGREIPAASELCSDCINGDRDPTLADFQA